MRSKLLKKLLFFSLMSVAMLSFGFTYSQVTVSGKVTDVNGPVPGANVSIKGTNKGTQTDFNGNYSIEIIDQDAILEISFIGYQRQEIPINSQKTIDIMLQMDQEALDQVVVVGYGSQLKREVTGSLQSIELEGLQDQPVSQVTQQLQGRLTGIQITEATGKPGQGMSIKIRGQLSVTGGSDPLYVVDGFPISGDISAMNPAEIDNITILKDAASTSLYGSRATIRSRRLSRLVS